MFYCGVRGEKDTKKIYLTVGVYLIFNAIAMLLIREWLIVENTIDFRRNTTTIFTMGMTLIGLLLVRKGQQYKKVKKQ